jgi:hypothetical protein
MIEKVLAEVPQKFNYLTMTVFTAWKTLLIFANKNKSLV